MAVPFPRTKDTMMKQSVIEHIQKICSMNLNEKNNMAKAQVMLKNFKDFKKFNNASGFSGNIPFEDLEAFLKKLVKKYDVMIGQILAITDVDGDVTWHGGMYYVDGCGKARKSNWLFTIHSDDLYEYMVKLVLLSFVSVKTSEHVKVRDPESVKDAMRRF